MLVPAICGPFGFTYHLVISSYLPGVIQNGWCRDQSNLDDIHILHPPAKTSILGVDDPFNNQPLCFLGWSLSQPFVAKLSVVTKPRVQKRGNLPTSKWCCECAIHGICRGELILPRRQETCILIRPCGTIHWDVDIVTCTKVGESSEVFFGRVYPWQIYRGPQKEWFFRALSCWTSGENYDTGGVK